jgi:molecular chaperone GrpE
VRWWRRVFLETLTENGNQSTPPGSATDLDRLEAAARAEASTARAELIERLDRLQAGVVELASADRHTVLVERLDQLQAAVAKLGREQFRAATLLEGHDTLLEELAEASRDDQSGREAAALLERHARAEIEARARLELVKELLPVADALDASVRASRDLLAALRETPAETRVPSRSSWLAWLRAPTTPALTDETTGPTVDDRSVAFDAWLRGLLLIEGRLQSLLEREGVRPIQALGEPFDPHRHLAVATSRESGAADGTVVAEELRGYLAGDRVLRHAEVMVARADGEVGRSDPDAD